MSIGTSTGRPPVTSHSQLEHVALTLFAERGFDETTVDQIAEAAGIGRRTFFRYFASKNDVAWGEFRSHLELLRDDLAGVPASVPIAVAVRDAVLRFNWFPPPEAPWQRRRMELLLRVPALQAHSALRYADWRLVISEFVAQRLGQLPTDLVPRSVAYQALGAAMAAYESWLDDSASDSASGHAPDEDDQHALAETLGASLDLFVAGLANL